MAVFEINGFFKDDKSKFESYLVTDYDSTPEGYKDDDFFFLRTF